MLEWQEKFAQMQLQQNQKLVEQHCELWEAQAKEQSSRHQSLIQRMEHLEREEKQHLGQKQKQLKEHVSGLQEQVHLVLGARAKVF